MDVPSLLWLSEVLVIVAFQTVAVFVVFPRHADLLIFQIF